MTAVRLNISISGMRDGEPWPPKGATVDLPDQEASDMIAQGYVDAVDAATEVADAAPAGETTDAAPAAPKPARKPRPRKAQD